MAGESTNRRLSCNTIPEPLQMICRLRRVTHVETYLSHCEFHSYLVGHVGPDNRRTDADANDHVRRADIGHNPVDLENLSKLQFRRDYRKEHRLTEISHNQLCAQPILGLQFSVFWQMNGP